MRKNQAILWKEILDLGMESCLAFLCKRKSKQEALRELKKTLLHQSQEHFQALFTSLKRLR